MPQTYDKQRFRKTYSFFRARPQALVTSVSGSGGDVDIDAVIFDDDGVKDVQNIRADRSPYQSPIDNTLNGIVNLSSELVGGPTAGVRAHYAACGGGEGNTILAGSDYACIPGGRRNQCGANYAFAVGNQCISAGTGSFSAGNSSEAQADYSFAVGQGCIASSNGSVALGTTCSANAIYAIALGLNSTASGAYSTAIGWNAEASALSSFAFGRNASSSGKDSFAFGRYANAPNIGQFSFSSFVFSNSPGTAQRNFLMLGNSSNNGSIVALQDNDGGTFTLIDDKTYEIQARVLAGSGGAIDKRASWTRQLLVHTSGSVVIIDGINETWNNPNSTEWSFNFIESGLELQTYFTGSVDDGNVRALVLFDVLELENP